MTETFKTILHENAIMADIEAKMKTKREEQRKNEQAILSETPAGKFATKLYHELKKIFPKSFVDVRFELGLGASISVYFTYGKDKTEYLNGISHNDPVRTILMIHLDNRDGSLPDKITVDAVSGTKIYNRKEMVKTGWRKKTGSLDVVNKHIIAYFEKLKKQMIELDKEERLPSNVSGKY